MPRPNTRLNIITREEDSLLSLDRKRWWTLHHLLHFFKPKRWEHLAKTRLEGNKLARYIRWLSDETQPFITANAGNNGGGKKKNVIISPHYDSAVVVGKTHGMEIKWLMIGEATTRNNESCLFSHLSSLLRSFLRLRKYRLVSNSSRLSSVRRQIFSLAW